MDFNSLVVGTEFQWCHHDDMILFRMEMRTLLEDMFGMVHSGIMNSIVIHVLRIYVICFILEKTVCHFTQLSMKLYNKYIL